jgi:hypothetical protein
MIERFKVQHMPPAHNFHPADKRRHSPGPHPNGSKFGPYLPASLEGFTNQPLNFGFEDLNNTTLQK